MNTDAHRSETASSCLFSLLLPSVFIRVHLWQTLLERAAHDRNDETLERIYIGRRFKNDTERLERLFEMYTEMTAKQSAAKKPAKRKPKAADA